MILGKFEEPGFLEMPHIHKLGLYTHITFHFTYNGENVVSVNVTTNDKEPVNLDTTAPLDVAFTYSVKWTHSETDPKKRYILYIPLIII